MSTKGSKRAEMGRSGLTRREAGMAEREGELGSSVTLSFLVLP